MKRPDSIDPTECVVRSLALAAALVALLAVQAARADTTISTGNTLTVTDPNNFNSNAGVVTIDNGGTLEFRPDNQGNYPLANNFIFAGNGGTISIGFKANDTDYTLNGTLTSTATGPQTLALATGLNTNGDRESATFNSGIPDVGDASALALSVRFSTQSGSQSWVNLNAVNTFTGPITLVQGDNLGQGYLTIGGTLTHFNGNTFGAGTLGSGSYAGAISLDASTILNYASSAPQALTGVISGSGDLLVSGSGTLTLAGVNTYGGNTTVNGGATLTLANSGGLKFVVADATNNKVTGGGSATLNGAFTIDTSAVTVPVGSWTLVDVAAKTYGGTFSVTGFSGPLANAWTKVEGFKTWTFNQTSGVLSLSSLATITAFGIPGSDGVIDNISNTIALVVPNGTNLATLAPTFTVTSGSCNQTSGAPPSPTFAVANPATYTVTDGAAVDSYSVTVTVAPPPPGGVAAGLALWLDASTSATMTLAGSTVNEWRSLAGGSAKASRRGGSPTWVAAGIDGIPTVHFDNSSWMNDGVDHAAPVTVLYVSQQTGGSHQRVLGATNNNWLLGYHGNQRNRFYFEGWVYGDTNGLSPDDQPHLYAATIAGSGQNSTVYADGVELAANQNGTAGPNNLQLNGYQSANELSDVNISEVVVYNRVLSAGELLSVSDYLAGKYGLKAKIVSFGGIAGAYSVIDQTAKTIALNVPFATDLATLAPTFTLSSGSCNQTSGAPPSPTFAAANPVTYTVTDGATVNSYQVTVTVLPQTTTVVFNLGPQDSGTHLGTADWIAAGTLPVGSFLRAVSIDDRLDDDLGSGSWASDLNVAVEGLLQIGSDGGNPDWANGQNGPGTTCVDTKTAGVDFPANIDLNAAKLYLLCAYGEGMYSGTLSVTYDLVTAGGYSDWAALHAGGQPANLDYNNDGVANGIAYFMGATGRTTNPSVVNGKVTWPHSASATGITYMVLTSQDLASWTDVTANAVDAGGFLTYTLPKTTPKLFVRLEVLAP